MKMLFMILAISLSLQSFASEGAALRPNPDPFLKLIARIPGVKQLGVYTIISQRCSRYLADKLERRACHSAVEKEVELLDFDFNDVYFVAFKKHLLSLMSKSQTGDYLNKVQDELNRSLSGEKPMPKNLWQTSVEFYGDDFKAARSIAVLFQDTSIDRAHLGYLDHADIPKSKIFQENRELLERVLETMELIRSYSGNRFQEIFYPSEVRNELSHAIYHFYVPLFLAKELKKSGTKPRYAMMAPTFMSLTYEFMSVIDPHSFEEFFKDPERLDPKTPEGASSITDILTGATGARFGVSENAKVKSYDEIGAAFSNSSAGAVKLLLNN
jgi:hypothetical protein